MNNYQPKVNQTQQYSDSQGEHIVCEGKLVLFSPKNPYEALQHRKDKVYLFKDKSTPIIISETEKIEVGDWVYNIVSKHCSTNSHIYQITEKKQLHNSNQYKILALPEQLSDKHLQAIVDGKMKDGDSVYVKLEKCDYKSYRSSCGGDGWLSKDHGQSSETCPKCNGAGHFILLNQQNQVTLFPAKQSLEEAFYQWYNSDFEFTAMGDQEACYMETFIAGAEWAKKNNY